MAQFCTQKLYYDILMGSMLLGVQVKIPSFASKDAPSGRSDCRLSVTSSPSLSDVVTCSVTFFWIVAFRAELTLITGLLLAEIYRQGKYRIVNGFATLLIKLRYYSDELAHCLNTLQMYYYIIMIYILNDQIPVEIKMTPRKMICSWCIIIAFTTRINYLEFPLLSCSWHWYPERLQQHPLFLKLKFVTPL